MEGCTNTLSRNRSIDFVSNRDRPDRCYSYRQRLSSHETMDEIIDTFLPLKITLEPFSAISRHNWLMITSGSLNLKVHSANATQTGAAINLEMSNPWVQVIRYEGRCYLCNGYHRCICARSTGVTHIPCIIRDVADIATVGMDQPAFFDASILASSNPPTLGHYSQGRALPVSLRRHTRAIHITWREYAVPDE